MRIDSSKRVIPMGALRQTAQDILKHHREIESEEGQLDHLVAHLAGVIDAHCFLLQRALCVHCANDVPLVYVEKWGEHLHNGELTCVASTARNVMGIEPDTQHDRECYHAS